MKPDLYICKHCERSWYRLEDVHKPDPRLPNNNACTKTRPVPLHPFEEYGNPMALNANLWGQDGD
jgi:hypothetical protein